MNSFNSNTDDDESNYRKMAPENKNRNSTEEDNQHQSTNTAVSNNVNEIVSGIVLPIVAELKKLQHQLSDVSDKLDALCESKIMTVSSQPKSNKRSQPDQEQAIPDTVASSSSKRSKVTASSQTSNDDVSVENENKNIIMKDKLSTKTTTTTTSKNTQEKISEENFFNLFPNEILHKILEFEGKRSYIIFGLINKRCNAIFKIYKILTLSFVWGYGPLKMIQERKKLKQSEPRNVVHHRISKGILWYKRMDVLNWLIEDVQENVREHSFTLHIVTQNTCKEPSTRYDILHEIFDRLHGEALSAVKGYGIYTISKPAEQGNLELIKWLRQYNFDWCSFTWCEAKKKGHDHVLQYLKDKGYPKRWRKDSYQDIDHSAYDSYDSDFD